MCYKTDLVITNMFMLNNKHKNIQVLEDQALLEFILKLAFTSLYLQDRYYKYNIHSNLVQWQGENHDTPLLSFRSNVYAGESPGKSLQLCIISKILYCWEDGY